MHNFKVLKFDLFILLISYGGLYVVRGALVLI